VIRYEVWPAMLCLIDSLQEHGSYCGATHIQKATFLAQELTGLDLGLDFRLYHHGPFSFDLRETLDELEAAEAVKATLNPPYGPKYAVTDNGYGFWAQFETPDFDPQPLEFVAEKLAPKNVAELEAYGTAALVDRELPSAPLEVRLERLLQYKPHISQARGEEAFQHIADWRREWGQRKSAVVTC